jgi:arginine N-succinyltransferase
MLVIRPVAASDLDDFIRLTGQGGIGLTSLPTNRQRLQQRIETSIESFHELPDRPGQQWYLFVLADSGSGRAVGTAAIIARAGYPDPVYSYRVGTVIHASRELNVYNRIQYLSLSNDYSGCTEIGSLLLDPAFRRGGNGKLLSKCRFLFIAEFHQGFADKVFAEMRGVSDDNGQSPFWDSLGKHFFTLEFAQADYLTGVISKTFIAELMPRQPLYVPLLTREAQAVIGKTHPATRPALKLLEQEGFRYAGYVDIFDAGPTVEASRSDIRAIRDSRRLPCRIGTPAPDADRMMASNCRFSDFRCTHAPVEIRGEQAVIDAATAQVLMLENGDPMRMVSI